MNQNSSSLETLFAIYRDSLPRPNEADQVRFLSDLHRRQRAKLLQPSTPWQVANGWMQNKFKAILEIVNEPFSQVSLFTRPLAIGCAVVAVILGLKFVIPVESNAVAVSLPTWFSNNPVSFHAATLGVSTSDVAVTAAPALPINQALPLQDLASSPVMMPDSKTSPVVAVDAIHADSFGASTTRFSGDIPQFVLVDSRAAYDVHAAF